MKRMVKEIIRKARWLLNGKKMKTVTGGWCGCCGRWVADAKFSFRDYEIVDTLFSLNTICEKCSETSGMPPSRKGGR